MPKAKRGKRRYKMDAPTYKHLLAWCDNEFPNDPDAAANDIAAFLEAKDKDDAEYYLDLGWRRVEDLRANGE